MIHIGNRLVDINFIGLYSVVKCLKHTYTTRKAESAPIFSGFFVPLVYARWRVIRKDTEQIQNYLFGFVICVSAPSAL